MKEKQSHNKEEEDEVGDPKSLLGSHRDLYGGSCHLLADQFELHSQVAKKHQMVLLEVVIEQSVEICDSKYLSITPFRIASMESRSTSTRNLMIVVAYNQKCIFNILYLLTKV